jgi:hypothetical protein
LTNCVVMDLKDAEQHWNECKQGGKHPDSVWGEEVAKEVAKRRREVQIWKEWVM